MSKQAQLADGTILEFPDGTPDAIMDAAVRTHMKANWQPTPRGNDEIHAMAGNVDASEGMSFPAQYAAGWGKSYHDTYQGMRQLAAAGADKVMGTNLSEGVQDEVDTSRRIDQGLSNAPGGKAGQWGGAVAQMATPGTNVGKVLNVGGKIVRPVVQGATTGGAFAAIQPTATGESRTGNVALGAGLGAVGGIIAPVVGAVGAKVAGAVSDEAKALFAAAKARGITLTPAQLSDSRFMKFLASQMQSLPFSGAKATAAAQRAAFNKAVAQEVGSSADALTPEAFANVKSLQSKQFEAITSRNNAQITPDVLRRLEGIVKEAEIAGPEVASATRAAVERMYEQAQTGAKGVFLPGKAYQALDSALGQVTKRGDTTAHFVGQVKHALREAMDASISPKDKAAWELLRRQYGNRKTVRDLVAKAGDDGISPAQLMGRVTATNAGKEAMATGKRGSLGELAKIGQRMKEPPDSGTASRILANNAFNPLAWPVMGLRALGGATAGRAANSQSLSRLLADPKAGNTLQGLSRLIEQKVRPEILLPALGISLPAAAQPKKPKKAKDRP